jgi:hypothetical protein
MDVGGFLEWLPGAEPPAIGHKLCSGRTFSTASARREQIGPLLGDFDFMDSLEDKEWDHFQQEEAGAGDFL